ncbi:unnamed protein product [Absidia cylindrospora]
MGDFSIAVGVFRLLEKKDIEILLLETSGEFGITLQRAPLEHWPYPYARNQVHLWSLAVRRDGAYELWRETHLTIIPSFDGKADHLQFYWAMKELVKDTIRNIDELAQSHTNNKAKYRYSVGALTNVITPTIIKLLRSMTIAKAWQTLDHSTPTIQWKAA